MLYEEKYEVEPIKDFYYGKKQQVYKVKGIIGPGGHPIHVVKCHKCKEFVETDKMYVEDNGAQKHFKCLKKLK